MKIISGEACSGKTTELIKKAHEENKYILCVDRKRAENIERMSIDLGLKIPFPITVNELPINSKFIESILIDDVEDVLQRILNKRIDYVTTSCEIEKLND